MINILKNWTSSVLNGNFSKIISFGVILAFSFSVGAQESAEVPAVSGEVAYILSLIHI